MTQVDQELVTAFTSVGESADRIACFQQLREQFLRNLPDLVTQSYQHDDLIWRLLQFRKQRKLPTHHREAKR